MRKNEIKEYKEPENNIERTLMYCQHYGPVATAKKLVSKFMGHDQEHYAYKEFLKNHQLTEAELEEQRKTVFQWNPCISIVIPLYNTPEKFLIELVESVEAQTYKNWQLCLADGSPKEGLLQVVEKAKGAKGDSRICYKYLNDNLGIAGNTNGAIGMATGDFIAFCDHDDLLTADAMYWVAKALNEDPTRDCIYSDEDKVDMEGKNFFLPHFKSDFNIDLLCSHNYITHLFVCKREIVESVGGIRSEYDGAQDHDFDLRVVEQAKNIYHIQRVLYHWRSHDLSTASAPEAKMYAYDNGRRAVEDHYKRCGIPAHVELDSHLGYYRTFYDWPENPLLSIIIPNMDHMEDLRRCIDSIQGISTYENYEIVIVENNSKTDAIRGYYQALTSAHDNISVVEYEGEFNFSKICNFGAKFAKGDYFLFLNNDTVMINPEAISEMMGFVQRSDVGAVGARLYYGNNTVQHAGVVLGLGGVANSAFLGSGREQVGYFYRSTSVQNYSAVTGACLLTSKEDFEAVAGFDEELSVAYNDIDYCLKLGKNNKLVVYTPFSQWYHLESISRGYDHASAEKRARLDKESDIFKSKWGEILENGDPYYNPNLSKTRFDFALGK